MYTFKSSFRRGVPLTAAIALAIGSVLPAIISTSAFADALNPLTDRSLALSSSAPGWQSTDGSGNTTYAQPNSGANGQKTGETFAFKVSTDSSATGTNAPIQAMTFQYCTFSAGVCSSPGDDTVHGTDTATTADLNVNFPSPAEVGTTDFSTVVDSSTGAVKAVPGYTSAIPGDSVSASAVAGNYVVYYDNAGTWTQSSGWSLATSTVEDGTTNTGQKNYITLTNATGLGIPSTTEVKVIFFGTTDNYITNPGSGAFFVKINTYKAFTAGTPPTVAGSDIIDGGVTVANVMNQSIQIQTKVLETMDFSVGTIDPDTLDSTGGATGGSGSGSELYLANGHVAHSTCDRILTAMQPTDPINVLKMGSVANENSLETDKTYSTHSYWRLSSNSSAGATVYYSGVTLSNTVGDQIDPIGATAKAPLPGSEQFGLALDNGTSADNYAVDYAVERDSGNNKLWEWGADNGKTGIDTTSLTADGVIANASWHTPQLFPLTPAGDSGTGVGYYGGGTGTINANYASQAIDTKFAFDPTSNTIPVPIASESTQVVDCVTGKMRYIANIAATTPAGIYTTSVNYIAAPQY